MARKNTKGNTKMMKSIAAFVGFDWIKNQTAKKTVRVIFNAGLAALSLTPAAAPVLVMLGLNTTAEAAAAVTAVLGAVEAVRGLVKHS